MVADGFLSGIRNLHIDTDPLSPKKKKKKNLRLLQASEIENGDIFILFTTEYSIARGHLCTLYKSHTYRKHYVTYTYNTFLAHCGFDF